MHASVVETSQMMHRTYKHGHSNCDNHACPCCCQAYNILRHSAGLLLSLLHLMAGAPVTDLAADPSKAMLKLQVCPLVLCCQMALSLAGVACYMDCGQLHGAIRHNTQLKDTFANTTLLHINRRSCGWTWTTRRQWSGCSSC
jgi:hypothetical protein